MIVFASVILISCSKVGGAQEETLDAIDQNDDVFPVITVSKPIANQVYTSGDSIIVEGKVTDDKKLYKGKVQIKNDANNFVMAEGYYETHFLSTLDYRVAYKAVVTVPTDYSIFVEFQDHGANTFTATIKVKVNP
ncbi:MAG TPA: hypothetical protein VGQ04_06915 [Chitinophagaceae bacterium]|jgi:hypothetical protein|nr:hypothetical protein [Chitinophagaceae bacterium]